MKYPRSVAVTWQTTLDQLGASETTLLNILAWFAPEPIPASVLKSDAATEFSQSLAVPLSQSLPILADFSMIRWDVANETITVHRVVQEILRTRQPDSVRFLTAALQLLDAARPEGNPADVRTWPAWEPLRAHVAFATAAADRHDIAVPTSRLLGELGSLFSGKALHKDAERLKRRALAIDERNYGSDSPLVSIRLNNLALTLQVTNRLAEAEPLMRRALAINEQAYGIEHPSVANSLSNLAWLLNVTNRLAEAEPLMRRALAIDEQSYGAEHPRVAIDLNNLAQLFQDTNRLAEAELLMRRGLAIDEQFYGAEHPTVAIRLNNLASLLQATDRLVEAEPLMRRVAEILESALGTEHPHVATCLNNLASLLQATHRLAEAEPLMRRALAIHEQSYGADHPDVAIDLNNLALLLNATNRPAEAEPLMRRALAITAEFKHRTTHEHPYFRVRIENYRSILSSTSALS